MCGTGGAEGAAAILLYIAPPVGAGGAETAMGTAGGAVAAVGPVARFLFLLLCRRPRALFLLTSTKPVQGVSSKATFLLLEDDAMPTSVGGGGRGHITVHSPSSFSTNRFPNPLTRAPDSFTPVNCKPGSHQLSRYRER